MPRVVLAFALVAALAVPFSAMAREYWATIQAGRFFSFDAPASMTLVPNADLERPNGVYDGDRFSISVGYGDLAWLFEEETVSDGDAPPESVERLVVDGRPATMVVWSESDECRELVDAIVQGPEKMDLKSACRGCGVTAEIYFAGPTAEEPLSLLACGEAGTLSDIQRLFRSVRFARP